MLVQKIGAAATDAPDASRGRHEVAPGAARPHHGARRRVLLIQNDREAAVIVADALEALHIETCWAPGGLAGIAATRRAHFDLLFVDLDLPDMPGITLIDTLRAEDGRTRFVVVSESVTASEARLALRVGALGVLGKPFDASDVLAAVQTALGPDSMAEAEAQAPASASRAIAEGAAPPAPGASRSVAERWATLVLNTIHAESDPKTIGLWAKSNGVSRSALCECCRLIHVMPHDARDFARFMRAIVRSGQKWEPEALLDLADARTLKKLLTRAGLRHSAGRTPTLHEFLEQQQWIPRGNAGLTMLRARLIDGNGVAAAVAP